MAGSSQKFIARNRAPRVQIEYDVELYGSEKKVQLPFVMGVMSDLSGKSNVDQGSVESRKFLEIDVDNFDERMKGVAPRAAFSVPNTLTGEGSLPVDLTFEKMSDFSPAAIAERVDALRPLLEARTQLSNLMTYMDGKAGAEALIETVLGDTALLGALAANGASRSEEQAKALDGLRAVELPEEEPDESGNVLDGLRTVEVADEPEEDHAAAALDALRAVEITEEPEADETAGALDALRAVEVAEAKDDASIEALDALRAVKIEETAPEDTTGNALDALRAAETVQPDEDNTQAEALGALRSVEVELPQEDTSGAALDALRAIEVADVPVEDQSQTALDELRAVEITEETDTASDEALEALRTAEIETPEAKEDSAAALDELRAIEMPEEPAEDESAAVLAAMPTTEPAEPETDQAAEVLAGLELVEAPEEEDISDAVLAGLDAPEVEEKQDISGAVLAGLEAPVEVEEPEDVAASVLAGLETVEPEVVEDTSADVLAGIEAIENIEEPDDVASALAGLEAPEVAVETDDLDATLAGLEAPVEADDDESLDDVLAGLDMPNPIDEEADKEDIIDAALAGLEAPKDAPEEDKAEDILAGLDAPVEEAEDTDTLAETLASIEAVEQAEDDETAEDILASLEPAEIAQDDENLDDILAGLDVPDEIEEVDGVGDILASLDAVEVAPEDTSLSDALAGLESPDVAEEETVDDILADLDADDEAETPQGDDDLDALLSDLDAAEPDTPDDDDLDALLADLEPDGEEIAAESAPDPEDAAEADDDLDALLADLEGDREADEDDDDLDSLLAGLADEDETDAPETDSDLDGDEPATAEGVEDDLESLLAGLEGEGAPEDGDDDLDNLLAGLEDDDAVDDGHVDEDTGGGDDDLDALLAGLEADADPVADETDDDLDALLAGLDDEESGDDDLDALLGELDAETEVSDATAAEDDLEMPTDTPGAQSEEPVLAFGQISDARPDPQRLERKRFRLAILGDFTGRAARGELEVGDALANRKPILLDPDTVEDVMEGFATTLVLPVGKEGAGVEVKLGGLDDLHPDELYENVEIFAALKGLKSQLGNGGTAESAAKSLRAWGEAHGRHVTPAKAVSSGNTVRADLKLSDFQKLIGDTGRTLAQPSPVDDLLARIVGPHIRKLPDPNVTAMADAVDNALSGAMRMVLHHPDFQSLEAQWRAIDLIARSIETDDTLEVVLYDITAEEIAADLTQSDDLGTSGFARLLTEEPMDEETGRGAYSALMGMYTFEETPPHAQLLGRIARVAAHVDAPFFGAITPGFIETALKDRHPLVAAEWDTLRAMPEAGHLALVTPRFMLRRPYGAKTEPIYEFEFEEFTQSAGLSGMLWANPVVLVAILLAKSFKENGPSMGLGQIMSLGDIPFHFVLDRYGDQVALPCTERNLTLDKVETVIGRGYLPVVSIKGRDDIRLASFQSLAGGEILGPWSGVAPPPPSPPKPPKSAPEADAREDEDAATGDDDLDALLSGFDLDADDSEDEIDNENSDDMDAELAALLADL